MSKNDRQLSKYFYQFNDNDIFIYSIGNAKVDSD